MASLHQVLAVEGNLKNQADATRKDLLNTFDKKRHHFSRKLVTFTPAEADAESVTEEQSELTTTVYQELDWIKPILARALDASFQVAKANTQAFADVKLEDGTPLIDNVPATALLELEKRVQELHDFVAAIPTLDPSKGFRLDTSEKAGVHVAREEVKTRTKKAQRAIVLYPATEQHPAQTQLISEDIPVGKVKTQEWSGLITVKEKGDMLERVETLRRAVKSARARANERPVDTDDKIGARLLEFVFGR
jgi:hypothetical protein